MDIIGIGTEIVECLRVGRMIEQHGEVFLRRVYSECELRDCQARKRATEHFAARWAAKEATFKAFGTPWQRGMVWTDIEIQTENGGKHTIVLTGAARELAQRLGVGSLMVSLAHCRAYATAYVIALGGPGRAWIPR